MDFTARSIGFYSLRKTNTENHADEVQGKALRVILSLMGKAAIRIDASPGEGDGAEQQIRDLICQIIWRSGRDSNPRPPA